MQNKLANTKSYLDKHFFKNAADSVEVKRKKKRQKDNRNNNKRKIRLRMDDNKKRVLEIITGSSHLEQSNISITMVTSTKVQKKSFRPGFT